jgi:leucyl/phenylalanyl-tRNA--protein transferase
MSDTLSADQVIWAYTQGLFPMGTPYTQTIQWHSPDPRGVIPLDAFHMPHNLARHVRRGTFRIRTDTAFAEVIAGCANRDETWITPPIREVFTELHHRGVAHSVECWKDDQLAGGLYGVALGGAFFGESMFFRESYASKVALAHLVRQMRGGGYQLLDTQYTTEHLKRFGAREVPRSRYLDILRTALGVEGTWWPLPNEPFDRLPDMKSAPDFGPVPS